MPPWLIQTAWSHGTRPGTGRPSWPPPILAKPVARPGEQCVKNDDAALSPPRHETLNGIAAMVRLARITKPGQASARTSPASPAWPGQAGAGLLLPGHPIAGGLEADHPRGEQGRRGQAGQPGAFPGEVRLVGITQPGRGRGQVATGRPGV